MNKKPIQPTISAGPCRIWFVICRLTVLTCSLLLVTPGAGRSDDQAARLLERVKQGYADYGNIFSRSPGQVNLGTYEIFDRTKPEDSALQWRTIDVTKIDRRSDSYLFSNETAVNNTRQRILNSCIAINSKYCFELRKWDAEKPWTLSRCVRTSKPDLDTQAVGFEDSYRRPSHQPTGGGTLSVRAILNDFIHPDQLQDRPDLVIESATEDERVRRAIVNFSYERPDVSKFDGTAAKTVRAKVRSTLTLDAEHYYLPVELHQTMEAHGEVHDFLATQEFTFESGKPVRELDRVCWKVTAGPRTLVNSETVSETRFEFRPVSESEFTLSAYGFPEPRGVNWHSRPIIPRYIWALAIGVGCLILYVIMRVRSARRKAVGVPEEKTS
jgi:hypothetical protein